MPGVLALYLFSLIMYFSFITRYLQESANDFVILVLKTVIYNCKLLIFKTAKALSLTFFYQRPRFLSNTN
ncbi:MAG: hypothetical protein DRI54_07205 [Bacteroidetes bacterium]|nr:MAG: hypothetical protein DRI54_07205 [Bacteroidota bacterium]